MSRFTELKTILITGGTGSFGKALVDNLINQDEVDVIRIFSRDEFKQNEMAEQYKHNEKLRFFIGDVRDRDRLQSAAKGAYYVVHAAAMKQIPACEYNPYEAVKTNILGTQNVISACVDQGVSKAIFISSDKAVNPVNLYGATKLVAEKIWLNANGRSHTEFSLTRWGNVIASRGSVIPLFKKQAKSGTLTITDKEMTRFWITLDEAVKFVLSKFNEMTGGEIFIPDIKSSKIVDVAKIIAPEAKIRYIGIRQGEKLHETLGDGYFSNDKKRLLSKKELKKILE